MPYPLVSIAWLLCGGAALILVLSDAVAQQEGKDDPGGVAGNAKVAEIIRTREGRGQMADGTPITAAEEAVKQFRVRKGFEVDLIASEPEIGQPLFLNWDSRGRLWVVQYLQYQFPAGLKIVEYDNHLRAVFDKVPEPPPHGTKGADKITVFEDADGDGHYESHQDVITGLNIATSVAVGHGGIWVTNPPYLLFYPDADRDGVPDDDPEVVLSGFGIEDTHAVANSLRWGPDGWLYAANGSTTTGEVLDPASGERVRWKGQNVWRYHPGRRAFEIYAEGGGNTFSIEIDAVGRVFSGTNNGNTRGMYYPQGSYGKKGWGKHGPLTNPYAFGYFHHMAHVGDKRRFSQAFTLYEGGLFPEAFNGKVIGPNSLQNVVWVSALLEDTSTFRTVDEANLLETDDKWFRPVYSGIGPDGAVYLADWCDTRLSHVSPIDDWHKESGRIYRVAPEGAELQKWPGDLAVLPAAELMALFDHPNRRLRRRAMLELGWRGEKSCVPDLESLVSADRGQASLEALWALHLLDGLNDALAIEWLGHPNEHIRRWVVRLIGDRKEASFEIGEALGELAARESAVAVRSQLASSAKRLPPEVALPILVNLAGWDEDLKDLHLPLLVWWGFEAQLSRDPDGVLALLRDGSLWSQAYFREVIAGRLMRRLAMEGGKDNLDRCARLLEGAPDADASKRLMEGLQQAFQGTSLPPLPEALSKAMDDYARDLGESDLLLGMRRGDAEALGKALEVLKRPDSDPVERIEIARLCGEIGRPEVVPVLLKLLSLDQQSALKRVALQSLSRYEEARIAETILARYGSTLPEEHDVRGTANRVLASRPEWASRFLEDVASWKIKAGDISPDVVEQIKLHGDPALNAAVAKHWPELRATSSEAKLVEIKRLREVLAAGAGEGDVAEGKLLYTQRCAACHTLFEEGGSVAPDLTGYERDSLDFWLPALVDPSLEIREGYGSYVISMKDGRKLMGMIAAQDGQSVTLRDIANQTTVLSRSELEEMRAIPVSLMPEALLTGLDDEQVRDLFAYLRLEAR